MSETRRTLVLKKDGPRPQNKRVAIVGFGTIGKMVANFLSKKHIIHILDLDITEAREMEYEATHFDLKRPGLLAGQLNAAAARNTEMDTKFDLVINCCPHFYNVHIAQAAKEIGSSYIDLSEDVESGKKVEKLAEGAKGWFIPRCGVAPGLVQIIAGTLASKFHEVEEIKMRVGALPRHANNALGYALTWSTDGLINEYANPCEAVVDGLRTELPPLEGLERAFLDGTEYEAFNTSGGLGTLVQSMKARNINYKTLRYPGHRDLMNFLLFDPRLLMTTMS
jgi:saccharopine dehydrogenase-like NADP-dependent oxidoreductase